MREEFAIIKLPEHVKLPDNDSMYTDEPRKDKQTKDPGKTV